MSIEVGVLDPAERPAAEIQPAVGQRAAARKSHGDVLQTGDPRVIDHQVVTAAVTVDGDVLDYVDVTECDLGRPRRPVDLDRARGRDRDDHPGPQLDVGGGADQLEVGVGPGDRVRVRDKRGGVDGQRKVVTRPTRGKIAVGGVLAVDRGCRTFGDLITRGIAERRINDRGRALIVDERVGAARAGAAAEHVQVEDALRAGVQIHSARRHDGVRLVSLQVGVVGAPVERQPTDRERPLVGEGAAGDRAAAVDSDGVGDRAGAAEGAARVDGRAGSGRHGPVDVQGTGVDRGSPGVSVVRAVQLQRPGAFLHHAASRDDVPIQVPVGVGQTHRDRTRSRGQVAHHLDRPGVIGRSAAVLVGDERNCPAAARNVAIGFTEDVLIRADSNGSPARGYLGGHQLHITADAVGRFDAVNQDRAA